MMLAGVPAIQAMNRKAPKSESIKSAKAITAYENRCDIVASRKVSMEEGNDNLKEPIRGKAPKAKNMAAAINPTAGMIENTSLGQRRVELFGIISAKRAV